MCRTCTDTVVQLHQIISFGKIRGTPNGLPYHNFRQKCRKDSKEAFDPRLARRLGGEMEEPTPVGRLRLHPGRIPVGNIVGTLGQYSDLSFGGETKLAETFSAATPKTHDSLPNASVISVSKCPQTLISWMEIPFEDIGSECALGEGWDHILRACARSSALFASSFETCNRRSPRLLFANPCLV